MPNEINTTRTVYLKANRTIEVIKLKSKTFYLYNFQGVIFYVFENVKELFKCIKNKPCWALDVFECEHTLDEFLINHNQ